MARTDKDRPYWVKVRDDSENVEEKHDHRPDYVFCVTQLVEREHTYTLWPGDEKTLPVRRTRTWTEKRGYRVPVYRDCDLDEWKAWREDGSRKRWDFNCNRWLTYQDYYRTHNVPDWYINHTWNAPERLRERTRLRDAVRLYNAGDDLDEWDFPNYQHRRRSGWYWD